MKNKKIELRIWNTFSKPNGLDYRGNITETQIHRFLGDVFAAIDVVQLKLESNEESRVVIQIRNTTGVLFLFSRHIIGIEVLARALSSFNLTRENTYHF